MLRQSWGGSRESGLAHKPRSGRATGRRETAPASPRTKRAFYRVAAKGGAKRELCDSVTVRHTFCENSTASPFLLIKQNSFYSLKTA